MENPHEKCGKKIYPQNQIMQKHAYFRCFMSYPHLLTKFKVDKNVDKLSTCIKTVVFVENL